MAERSVREWLAAIGCEQYVALFEGSGYPTVNSLASLDDERLTVIGVFDANHRRAILTKAHESVASDFDSMLGDLTSVIRDLESFTVTKIGESNQGVLTMKVVASVDIGPAKIDTTTLSTNTAFSSGSLDRARKTRSYMAPEPPKPPEPDFDLDSLLSDLTSFNPSDVVMATHSQTYVSEEPPPVPLPQQAPSPATRSPATRSPAAQSPAHAPRTPQGTPHHNHTAPLATPPHTPGHTPVHTHHMPPRSYTEVSDPRGQPRVPVDRQRSYSQSSQDSPQRLQDGDRDVQMVPQPDLQGATAHMSAEAVQSRLEKKAEELKNDDSLSQDEREAKLKEEKMRIGIEKMKLAHKKKVAIKVFNPDRSNKTVVVEEGMTSGMVCHLLVVKNHFDESPNWVLVEQLGDVSLERELEDHENVVDVYGTWPREHSNVFLFKQNERKYDLFEDPMKYFPGHLKASQAGQASGKLNTLERSEKARKILLQEFFSTTTRVPELEGWLHLKDGYKKGWKKVYFILRASGLYYSKAGKQKTAKHLALLVQFDEYELYHGINFKKTLKAPTQFCFALRPIPRAHVPGPKDIKVLCADDGPTALSWTAGIRLAKYGHQLRDNFHKAKLTQFKLEDLTAPEGAQPKAVDRASKLVGLRLEKHMDKIREQYLAQKAEQEERKQRYSSPQVPHKQGDEEGSSPPSSSPSLTPERTPEPSPRVQPKPSPLHHAYTSQAPPTHANGVQVLPPPSPHTQPTPYNPYPPPSQPAPPPRSSPSHRRHTPPPVAPRPHSPPVPAVRQASPRASPDKEGLYAFAWYHGSISRDEATRRLESAGGFDGVYLVRDSTTVLNSYVLTMFAKSVAKNFQVLLMDHPSGIMMYRIDDGPAFANVEHLLNHYKQDSDRLPCRLTEFCPRPPTRMTEC